MEVALKPFNEAERLNALKEYKILDTAPEQEYSEVVELASSICETPISTVTLVDEGRQWFKARVGLRDSETHRDFAFCAHAIHQEDVMIVPDATKDKRFHDNPLVTSDPDIRFYAGMPLINPEGFKLGTLCVIDRKPKNLSDSQLLSLRVLGRQVVKQMELRKKVNELARLNDANHKLLSLIGHDLRSPFSSLYGLLELSENYDLTHDEFKEMIPQVKNGFTSANQLLSNLLDWATSQFSQNDIKKEIFSLPQLADEIIRSNDQVFKQKKNIVSNLIESGSIVVADKNMVKAVVRNLLMNANKFTKDGFIALTAHANGPMMDICIADTGIGMDAERLEKMFSWAHRSSTNGTSGEPGSGFGLLLCQEFVEKNGGRMWVNSTRGKGSSFYFSLPGSQL